MGIRGLEGLIRARQDELLDDLKLCDSTVIIDGLELLYYLYFDCVKDNGRCGGEYSDLRKVIFSFFDTLNNRCKVRCYVIFDEFTSEGNISLFLEDTAEKLQSITRAVDSNNNFYKSSESKAEPVVARDVLKQTLHELRVPYVVVPRDGDSVTAAVANELSGYVLASDTDYCVYDLAKGFLPFSFFSWEKQVNGKFPCKVFHRKKLESKFRLPTNAIYFLGPILSKRDGLKNVNFRPVIDALAAAFRHPPPYSPVPLLIWLGENYINDDRMVIFLRQHVRNLPEDDLKRCLEWYRNLPNVAAIVDDLEQGGHRIFKGKKCFYAVCNPPVLSDFLQIVPDDQGRPSCNRMSSSIRYAMYQINPPKDVEEQGLGSYQVWVSDRKNDQYTAEIVNVTIDGDKMEALQLHLENAVLMGRADMNDIIEERRLYIFDVLLRGEKNEIIEYFGDDMKFVAAVFRYWSTSSEDQERHVEKAIKALAFTICATYYETALPSEIDEMPQDSFDKQALHSSSQWLSCMQDAMRLDGILGEPLECPLIGKLFSGILYQRAFAYFVGTDDLDIAAVSLFSDNMAQDGFESLLRIASGMDLATELSNKLSLE